MKISVIGLGYVGYPLALLISSKGYNILGIDKKEEVVEKINSKKLHIDEEFSKKLVKTTSLKAKKNLESSDIYIICVPTPVNGLKEPDLTAVKKATEEVSSVLKENQLVIIESTIYPGVCEELIKPILDKKTKNYFLAHCPERINPGNKKWNVSNIPRVVAGIDKQSGIKAKEFYESVISSKITLLSQIKAAEATKILENTFRDINIAFVNEMAQSFDKIDVDISEVIKGASTKPFGFLPHFPGIGVGGHCIAVDPYYMIKKGKENGFEHTFLKQARKINSLMPKYTLKIIQEELNKIKLPINGTKITVLGLSYKPNVSDDRESPSYELIKLLKEKGADLKIYDPYLKNKSNVDSLKQAVKNTTCIVIATAHSEFLKDPSIFKESKIIIDGRNCLNKEEIKKMNILYRGIGRK